MQHEKLPYWPAAMDQKTAASYCGLCVDTFKDVCPVKPLQFTASARGARYLRQRLDEWLLSMDPNNVQHTPKRSIVDLVYGSPAEARRA